MLSLKISRYFSQAVHTPICIVGAGSGGISLLGHLIRQKGFLPHQVRIFDPSKLHHYQPGWTMIASGLSDAKNFVTETHKMINKFVPWESTAVSKILPKENKIITSDGKEFTYDHLVLSTGFRIDYNKIEGFFLKNIKFTLFFLYFKVLSKLYKTLIVLLPACIMLILQSK